MHFFACNPAKTPYLCRQIDNTHPTTHNTMKRRTSLFFLMLLLLLVGCKEKIDLKQVDSSMSVKTTIAAPLITIKAPLSEILGINDTTGRSDSLQWLYVKDSRYGTDKQLTSLIPEGTLYFRDTFNITRDFHPIDLRSFIKPVVENLGVYDQFSTLKTTFGIPVSATSFSIPTGTAITLSFPLTVKLDDLNTPTATDHNRVDSMIISTAQFNSQIETNFGLQDADIQQLTIKFPEQFTQQGLPMPDQVIVPQIDNGDTTKVQIDNFEICMLTDGATPATRQQHVSDRLTFTIEFQVLTTHPITLDEQSTIDYTFDVALLTYDVLFGYFNPSTWMEDNDTLVLAEEWPIWNDIKKLKMRFVYPTIRLIAEHQIGTEEGSPLYVNLSHIGVAPTDENGTVGEFIFAKFGENGDQTNTIWKLYDELKPETSRIDPVSDSHDKWTHNEYIVGYSGYEEGTHVGDVEKLFDIRPDVVGYKYDITVGPKNNPAINSQLRVTNNTNIYLKAVTVVPFVCDEGSELSFKDTIDVDLSSLNFDSITQSSQWLDTIVDGVIYLYLYADNSIPFDLTAQYTFYDEQFNVINLPLVTDVDGVASSYQMTIPAPTEFNSENKATNMGKNTIILRVSRADFDLLHQIRHLIYTVSLDNNPQRVTVWMQSAVDIKIGVSANIEAIINLSANKKEED